MQELTLFEVLKYAFTALIDSKVFVLLMFEIAILLVALIFSKLINKTMVRNTSIFASLIVLAFYISNYVSTVITFINNVSTRFMELLYFPTTLEFVIMMGISFMIMTVTLLNRKSSKLLKVVNTILPTTISFILLCIIEFINVNKIAFDEFSVFTNPFLSSLYQLGMGLFIAWILGLIVYKIDKFVINRVSLNNEENKDTNNLVTVKLEALEESFAEEKEEEIEMPRLKHQL